MSDEERENLHGLEVPITEEWRPLVVEGRRRAGLDQTQLAERVKGSQSDISLIESTTSPKRLRSSGLVMAIVDVLQIPPPVLIPDQTARYWATLGAILRASDKDALVSAVDIVERMIIGKYVAEAALPERPKWMPRRKKPAPLRPTNVKLVLDERVADPRRAADALPWETPTDDKPAKPPRKR